MRRYKVRQLTAELHALIAGRYPLIEVEGEVSQLSTPASGHAYLSLRDDDAVISAVIWRNTWRGLRHRPTRGDRVVCRGKLGVYGGRGSYQLYVHDVAPAGEGALAAEIARRRARLEADGLLDPRRKRPLPRMPRVVGVATSLTGAALQDFLKVSRERFPAARVLVAGCTVQGPTAPASVIQALDLLLEDGRSEVIVVTRGGGSKEALLAFQDEGVARFVAHCPVPVVSAVGHQVDTSLVDLVADAVAPTPTAAAVTALPDGAALAQRVDEAALALQGTMRWRLDRGRERLVSLRARLRHPGQRLVEVRRRARELERRLEAQMAGRLRTARQAVTPLPERLSGALTRRIPAERARVEALEARAHRAIRQRLAADRSRVDSTLKQARALSPVSVLERGFAVVVGPDGALSRASEARTGQRIDVRMADGAFVAEVLDGATPASD